MTIEEKIAVMQAYADGKKIEYKLKTKDNWCINPNPDWNWGACEYRVKSEKKIRPYTFEELQAEMAKGKIAVKQLEETRIITITDVMHHYNGYVKSVELAGSSIISFEQLMEGYQWLDGTSCGILEEE